MSDKNFFKVSGSFSRPANTTAYASGDLVADTVTAGSVEALVLTAEASERPLPNKVGAVRRVMLKKSATSTTNADFRIHLFTEPPTTFSNGDNGALACDGMAGYLGFVDVTVGSTFLTDGSAGYAGPTANSFFSGAKLYAVIEARAAYTPASEETFTVEVEGAA
ncbi:MAG: hypothetical protein AAFW97_14590 [Pseudomonadota bacterium]